MLRSLLVEVCIERSGASCIVSALPLAANISKVNCSYDGIYQDIVVGPEHYTYEEYKVCPYYATPYLTSRISIPTQSLYIQLYDPVVRQWSVILHYNHDINVLPHIFTLQGEMMVWNGNCLYDEEVCDKGGIRWYLRGSGLGVGRVRPRVFTSIPWTGCLDDKVVSLSSEDVGRLTPLMGGGAGKGSGWNRILCFS